MFSKIWFQSTFPHGERLTSLSNIITFCLFQSTFPHGERPKRTETPDLNIPVSIHVPARGTTDICQDTSHAAAVSIHVPARGTTPSPRLYNHPMSRFNPRSRTGNDVVNVMMRRQLFPFQSTFPHGERHDFVACCPALFQVSIHVPARGTTWDARH